MDRELQEAFGDNMRALRLLRDLTQFEMAEAMEQRHRTYIGAVERGERNLKLQTVASLCRAAGVDPFDLLRRPGEPGTPAKAYADAKAEEERLRAAESGKDPAKPRKTSKRPRPKKR